jgi:cation diffusion facilitator CzcD-associated flavoprotein CzcO
MTGLVDAIVIGAGPYGLAAAAGLREAGASVHVFGSPMSFWMGHMPKGMWLRSLWDASHIGDPKGALALDAFERARGQHLARPIPLSDFIAYGRWFQEHAVPDIDPRQVVRVDPRESGFVVSLEDGDRLESRRLLVAAGIASFACRPPQFDGIPAELATHSSEHGDLAHFAGRRVAVIGGGQSAIETAALLHESGADVEVIMRAPRLQWVGRAPRAGLVGRLLFDRTDVGPGLISHLVARPKLLRVLPRLIQRESTRRALAPGASHWLQPRMQDVTMTAGRTVTAATRSQGQVELQLDDGTARTIDHVILATGYRVDVSRYSFITPALLARVRCVSGQPVLDGGLESSLPGLHFLGAPATHSFGPLLRFVSGTAFAARAVVRAATGARRGAARATESAAEIQQAAHQAQ